MAKLIKQLEVIYKSHYRSVVAFALGMVVALTYGLFVERLGNGDVVSLPVATTAQLVEESSGTESTVGLPLSAPKTLRIPAIDLETTFEGPLGLNYDQTVQVPDSYEQVGWYQYGPTPGELGPAVILGHVDSYQGPAVFFSLGQLEAGDEIFIDRVDGTVATFTVTHLERHSQKDFPTEKVYGDIDHAGLRLITCTGNYDRSVLRYTHNLIVFAELVEVGP
jgi:sortase (surface protein transpeptidase)